MRAYPSYLTILTGYFFGDSLCLINHDRNPSGIVFFGTNPTDQVFESNANFTIDGTTLVATNLKISNGGNIGSASDADAISIASNGDVTMSQDLTITGDLTVNGATTTVSTTNTLVSDLA